MSVNLQKGQKVDLTKGNSSLKQIMVCLGWDEVDGAKKGIFGKPKKANIDCDASAIVCGADGRLIGKDDIVYFGNRKHKSGSIEHMGDNLTGAGDGDDEAIFVELPKVPETYSKIVFVVNIYKAVDRKQHFGMISNAFIRIVDRDTNQELCKFNLSENYDNMTAMIFGELYRHQSEWKFNAIGEATTDVSIEQILQRYR